MSNIEKHAESLQKLINGELRLRELMKNHTTFHIGGPADIFALPSSVEDIRRIIKYAKANDIPYYVIGNGSNLLVADSGIRGIVIKISKRMSNVEFDGEVIKAQAGILLPHLSRMAAEHELSGLEYGIGIPGTLGGAVVMNVGAGVQDTSQIVTSVKAMNAEGTIIELEKENLGFGYRESRFKRSSEIVLEAELQLQHSEQTTIKEKMRKLLEKRRKTMPLNYPSAGSVFKNPEGDYAGRLIEQAGCKGMRKGDAQVSELHANWIVNLGQAKASDVLSLIAQVQNAVRIKCGVQLQTEVLIF